MGMYTELVFAAELEKDLNPDIVMQLQVIVNGPQVGTDTDRLKRHYPDLEKFMFLGRVSSFYFPFTDPVSYMTFDSISKSWLLHIRCSIKNYHGQIEAFLEWIAPHVAVSPGKYLGHFVYEEQTETPLNLIHSMGRGQPFKITPIPCPLTSTELERAWETERRQGEMYDDAS